MTIKVELEVSHFHVFEMEVPDDMEPDAILARAEEFEDIGKPISVEDIAIYCYPKTGKTVTMNPICYEEYRK